MKFETYTFTLKATLGHHTLTTTISLASADDAVAQARKIAKDVAALNWVIGIYITQGETKIAFVQNQNIEQHITRY